MKPQVEFAEPNFLISKSDITPNDAQFNEQWALRNTGQNGGEYGADINASGAWPMTTGSPVTVIAVIDSGIDFTHPDLANNQWTNINPTFGSDLHGWDYITDNGVIEDEQGHGTAIAGVIAAEGNNSAGVSGVMWRASLMSLRVLDQGGNGDVADAVEAIDYAVTNGAQVINLSWGTAAESMALKDAIQRAIKRHVVVVCSAGNGGKDLSVAPYLQKSSWISAETFSTFTSTFLTILTFATVLGSLPSILSGFSTFSNDKRHRVGLPAPGLLSCDLGNVSRIVIHSLEDYQIHIPAIRVLLQPQYRSLWNLELNSVFAEGAEFSSVFRLAARLKECTYRQPLQLTALGLTELPPTLLQKLVRYAGVYSCL
jgi:subtilisin family serine protease